MPFFKRCARCRTTIAFGGCWHDGNPFCDGYCAEKYAIDKQLCIAVGVEEVMRRVEMERDQNCAHCGGAGPVDVYPAIETIGMLIITRSTVSSYLCCHKCGVRFLNRAINRTLFSSFFVYSPWAWYEAALTIGRNSRQIKLRRDLGPSKYLIDYVKELMRGDIADQGAQPKRP